LPHCTRFEGGLLLSSIPSADSETGSSKGGGMLPVSGLPNTQRSSSRLVVFRSLHSIAETKAVYFRG
jgi:hypothetical protein